MEKQFSTLHLQSTVNQWPSFEDGYGVDERAAAAGSNSKSHSEAEKRRRDRINVQLHSLRKLTPNSEHMDKAALLANVVQHVKELKLRAAEVCKIFTVPSDIDEVKISTQENNSSSIRNTYIEVSICCEERPGLLAELRKIIQSLKLQIVRAEIASLGCRVQIELLLSSYNTGKDNDCISHDGDSGLLKLNLIRTLRANLNRVVNSTTSVSRYRVASKRQRFFYQQIDS